MAIRLSLLCLLLAGAAFAQRSDHAELAPEISRDYRGDTDDQLVLPERTLTATPQVRFLMADGGLADRPIAFTDVMLIDAALRASLGGAAELFALGTFMPKQPAGSKELFWQGVTAGARLALTCAGKPDCRGTRGRLALGLDGRLAPLLQRQGLWSSAELLLEGQYLLHESIFLRGSLGGGASSLWWRADGQATWFGEAVATAEIVFRVREAFAGWVGAELRVPFGPWGAARLTPTTRVCARIGVAATWVREWDVFAELQILDRGDLAVPGTTIPAIDGGFDQRVLMIGVTHRFDLPGPPHHTPDA